MKTEHKHVFDSDIGWFHTTGDITTPVHKIIGTSNAIVLYCECGMARYIVQDIFWK